MFSFALILPFFSPFIHFPLLCCRMQNDKQSFPPNQTFLEAQTEILFFVGLFRFSKAAVVILPFKQAHYDKKHAHSFPFLFSQHTHTHTCRAAARKRAQTDSSMFSNAHKVSCALFIKNEYSNWGLKIGERHTHDSTVDNEEEEEVEKEEEAEAKNEKKNSSKWTWTIFLVVSTPPLRLLSLYIHLIFCVHAAKPTK